MVENNKRTSERIARAAVADYASLGPEYNFGEVELNALNAWIAETNGQQHTLSPTELAHVAWMHIERCWSRMAETGELGSDPGFETTFSNSNDLASAHNLFKQASKSADKFLHPHIKAALAGHPIMKAALHYYDRGMENDPAVLLGEYILTLMENNEAILEAFTKEGTLHDIPNVDAALGLRLLCGEFLIRPPYLPLVSALRHSQSGALSARWHFGLYNWETNRTYKVRVAPHGPADMIVLPPSLFRHGDIPTKHGRGMLQAVAYYDAQLGGESILGAHMRPVPQAVMGQYAAHAQALFQRTSAHLKSEIARVTTEGTYPPPADPLSWFEQLSPFADPAHKEYGGGLEAAISHLELVRANGENTTESDYLLGWMYMDAGQSRHARDTSSSLSLLGNFERAEDIFASARDALPPAEHQTSRYFELAMGEATARLQGIITYPAARSDQEILPGHIDTYCQQLAILAPQMLAAYEAQPDKTAGEALALHRLVQLVTICLAMSYSDDKRAIGLIASPRQRGGINGAARGWDFNVWVYDSPDTYVPGPFCGRVEDKEDFYSVDEGVVTLTPKKLGINSPKALMSLLHIIDPTNNPGRADNKALKNIRQRLTAIAYE